MELQRLLVWNHSFCLFHFNLMCKIFSWIKSQSDWCSVFKKKNNLYSIFNAKLVMLQLFLAPRLTLWPGLSKNGKSFLSAPEQISLSASDFCGLMCINKTINIWGKVNDSCTNSGAMRTLHDWSRDHHQNINYNINRNMQELCCLKTVCVHAQEESKKNHPPLLAPLKEQQLWVSPRRLSFSPFLGPTSWRTFAVWFVNHSHSSQCECSHQ